MRRLRIAILLGAMTAAAGCSTAGGAPADPAEASTAAAPSPSLSVAADLTMAPARATPASSPASDPLPDGFIGAWYHSAPAYWWFLRAGSPTCVTVAHTDADCVAYQLGAQPAYVGAASMDGRLLRIRWTRGYCAGDRTNFGTGIDGNTLKLFDTDGDCGGDNLVLSRAGTGTAPSAPPPPER